MSVSLPGEVDSKLSSRILDAVADGFESQLDFTMDLMRQPSVRGQENGAQSLMYTALESRGYQMDRWAIDIGEIEAHPGFSPVKVDYSNAINVVGTHVPEQNLGRSLILNGHVDVVPTCLLYTSPSPRDRG